MKVNFLMKNVIFLKNDLVCPMRKFTFLHHQRNNKNEAIGNIFCEYTYMRLKK